MAEVNVESQKLQGSGDRELCDDVYFLPKKETGENFSKVDKPSDEYPLLTKEDLIRLDKDEPIWRRIRIALIAIFWIVWILLLIASALIIVFTPKCPPRPSLLFWQSKSAYWVNPFAFKDSDGDLVGDLKGIVSEADYIASDVGAGFIILTTMSPWYPRHIPSSVKYVPTYDSIHPSLGTMNDFVLLLKSFKKKGIEVVISLDFNGIPVNHTWASDKNNLIPFDTSTKLSRTSKKSSELVDGTEYYSTYGEGSGMVDLNLKSEEVLTQIKNVTNFWLSTGVDGILLSDAAFFVESTEGCADFSSWFPDFPSCRLFTNGTVHVVQELRTVVDASAKKTGRPKVLIADAGNIGYGIGDTDSSTKLLASKEEPGAHMTLSREFTLSRGWKRSPSNDRLERNSISSLTKLINASNAHFGLMTASPSDAPHFNLYSLVASTLMPGTPIVYYGSELGLKPSCMLPNSVLYPFGDAPQPNEDSDSVICSNLPMPWDRSGRRFSSSDTISSIFPSYLLNLGIEDSVESATAAGREYNVFNLTRDLLALKKAQPSLLWGKLVMDMELDLPSQVEVFKRKAEGFPAIVTALFKENTPISVIDFSKICSTLTPILVHPPNEQIKIGVELPKTTIYFNSPEESAYVFKCDN